MREKIRGVLKRISAPLPLVLLFLGAVLLPSIALSMLALRAADREALHLERSLESALLSEVNLAANRITDLLSIVETELEGEASEISSNPVFLERWRGGNALASSPFLLVNGRLFLPEPLSAASETLRSAFAPFLEGDAELPVFDHIAGVYRRELNSLRDDAVSYVPRRDEVARTPDGKMLLVNESTAPERSDAASKSIMPPFPSETTKTVAVSPFVASETPEKSDEDFTSEAFPEVASEEKAPLHDAPPAFAPPPAPAPAVFAPQALVQRIAVPGGAERQMAESRIAVDSSLREEVFRKAEEEGFELLQRNVAPVARTPSVRDAETEEPSKTVVRRKRFDELRTESPGGLLPRLSDEGFDLLFWSSRSDGTVAGFLLDTEVLKDRILGVLPEMLTDTRILAVLDDRGEPLLLPDIHESPDWRRPFVAREISPLLPRWEAGAWLADPSGTASRARSSARAVWLLVGVLFVVIVCGGALILWMLSSEMRLARQKTTFVANVSHELKTPLTSIRLFAEILLSGRQKDEERRKEYLRTMVSEAERLSRLVENVLAFSREGNGKKSSPAESLDLAELARGTLLQLEPYLSKNGFVCSFSSEGAVQVLGGSESLRQVFMNLLSNAEKYSEQVREIDVRCRRERRYAIVEIADRGPGVPLSQVERIFQEFFRGDDSLTASRSGAGLGLAIARSIARRHGGDVSYAPRIGGGSVFSLTIPLEGVADSEEGGGTR